MGLGCCNTGINNIVTDCGECSGLGGIANLIVILIVFQFLSQLFGDGCC